ncbi:hypothetical protein EMCRGX_G025096 [Ephydatia muelleri]
MGADLSYPVVDLTGKVAIVTGGNTGIGYETAKALATMGAHTIVACRSAERATEALTRMQDEVRQEFPDKQLNVEWMILNLASFESTKQFVIAFKARNLQLHILINNAAIALLQERTLTADGYEQQFQASVPASIAGIAIYQHVLYIDWNPDNLNGELSYGPLKFYNNSKLYNILTSYALQRRLPNMGITVSSLHPGVVDTDLNQHSKFFHLFALAVKHTGIARTPRDGAATTINCAVNPQLNSQQAHYYSDCHVTQSSDLSRDEAIQEQLWRKSVAIVKDYLSPDVLARYGETPEDVHH